MSKDRHTDAKKNARSKDKYFDDFYATIGQSIYIYIATNEDSTLRGKW